MNRYTLSIAIILLAVFSQFATAAPLQKSDLIKFDKMSDVLTWSEYYNMYMDLQDNYVLDKIQTCMSNKLAPFADKPQNDEAGKRRFVRVQVKCHLEFWDENVEFQKSAMKKSRKEVESLLTQNADDITADAAKESVIKIMPLLPRRNFASVTESVLLDIQHACDARRDFDSERRFEGKNRVTSVIDTLTFVDPVTVYRSLKKVLLRTSDVWVNKQEVVPI